MKQNLASVVAQFEMSGAFVRGGPYGTGHINDTYAVVLARDGGEVRYILQRINHSIFTEVPRLMDNIVRVTDHLAEVLRRCPGHDPLRETLTVIPTRQGHSFFRDDDGSYWRCYVFIEGARTYDAVQNRRQAYEAARAFGLFQKRLMDLPGPPLVETIPDFHHTPKRFQALARAIDEDRCGRAAEAAAEIEFALAREAMCGTLIAGLEAGDLPLRTTHNDTKINNVMIDDRDGTGICVIDLDTVMPGLVLYDFGDQVRTTTATAAEDERDLSKVTFRLDMFESLVSGYLDAGADFLTDREIGLLAFSGRLITFEIGIRFLTDFLQGDVYFKTHRPGHNLDRTRTQFEMVRQMEHRAADMEAMVDRCRP